MLLVDVLHGGEPLLPGPHPGAQQGVQEVPGLVPQGLRGAALQSLPVHLQHGLQLVGSEVAPVDGLHYAGYQEAHLLGETLSAQLEAELGRFEGVEETCRAGGVAELSQLVLESVDHQVVDVALPGSPGYENQS